MLSTESCQLLEVSPVASACASQRPEPDPSRGPKPARQGQVRTGRPSRVVEVGRDLDTCPRGQPGAQARRLHPRQLAA
jgi:hypothetical protein